MVGLSGAPYDRRYHGRERSGTATLVLLQSSCISLMRKFHRPAHELTRAEVEAASASGQEGSNVPQRDPAICVADGDAGAVGVPRDPADPGVVQPEGEASVAPTRAP